MTADTYSNTLGYLIMGTGNDNNVWGGYANSAVFQIFEDAIANALTSSVTGGTLDLSGSPPPAAASQTRYAALIFSGTLGSNQIVQVPNLIKFWWVKNATAGAFTLTFKTSSGSASTAIPQNSGWQLVQCDGSNVITVSPFNSVQVQMPDGSAAAPAYSNLTEPTAGWYRAGTQDWRFAINGAAVFQITGPGASSPSIVNVLSPNNLQLNGGFVIPIGISSEFDGIVAPSGWAFKYGQAVSRTTYSLLFAVLTISATATTNTSITLTSVSADLTGIGLIGAYIEGTGIATGTTIVAITATTITLSNATASSGAGVAIRILPHGQGDASTTFNLPNDRGRMVVGRDDMGGTAANVSQVTTTISTTNTLTAATLASAAGVAPGMYVVSANVPAGTTISSMNGTAVTLSAAATATASGTACRISALRDAQSLAGTGGTTTFVLLQANLPNVTLNGSANLYQTATTATIPQVIAPSITINYIDANAGTSSQAVSVSLGGVSTAVAKTPPARVTNKIIFTGVFA